MNPRAFRKNLIYLMAGSRGGPMRVKIMNELILKPMNPNQLSEKLMVDYKTITHHLSVLIKQNWITRSSEKYAELFSSAFADDQIEVFNEVLSKIGKKL